MVLKVYLESLPPDYFILDRRVFENFILADELFVKAYWSLETCVLVNNIFVENQSLIIRISNHIW